MDRWLRSVLAPISRLYGALLAACSDGRAVFPPETFPWAGRLEAEWEAVRDEMEAVRASTAIPSLDEIAPGESKIADERWKVFVFRIFSREIPENCRRCPRTYALLRRLPGVTSAYFSILEPGKRIPPHRGPFRGVLRYHLGLKVPKSGDCRIRIAGRSYAWEEGKSLVFDDTYEHEVVNDTAEIRAVLFLDVLRPLPAPVRWLNQFVYWGIAKFAIPRLVRHSRAVAAGLDASR